MKLKLPKMPKKAALSLQIIIIAVLLLIVLVVLIVIFTQQTGKFIGGTKSCDAKGGECADSCNKLLSKFDCSKTTCFTIPNTDCVTIHGNTKKLCCVPLTTS